jgi:site-specific DNA-methyltransferase (adenine-specific)
MSCPQRIPHIPASRLIGSYKAAPVLWRHSLHTICSRVAMFPPPLTHYFIELYSKRNEVVADPWAGVGTAPLQACLDGRIGVGADISPEACTVMYAKLHPISLKSTLAYLEEIETRIKKMRRRHLDRVGRAIGVSYYFNRRTLGQILKIRELLRKDRKSKSLSKRKRAVFVSGLMLGILHGDRRESLSLEMDSSKAYSPKHILKMQEKYPGKYLPKYHNVVSTLRIKASKVLRDELPCINGFSYELDSSHFPLRKRAKLVVTSPPYLRVHEYAYDNRVRLWFLGYDYKSIQPRIFSSENLQRYFDFVSKTLLLQTAHMTRNAACVVMFGDVRTSMGRKVKLGELFAEHWLKNHQRSMRLSKIIVDRVRPTRRRYFNLTKTQGIRCERILVFHKGNPDTYSIQSGWSKNNSPLSKTSSVLSS